MRCDRRRRWASNSGAKLAKESPDRLSDLNDPRLSPCSYGKGYSSSVSGAGRGATAPGTALERVTAFAAGQVIDAASAVEPVAAEGVVVARPALYRVVAVHAPEGVRTVSARQGVGPLEAEEWFPVEMIMEDPNA